MHIDWEGEDGLLFKARRYFFSGWNGEYNMKPEGRQEGSFLGWASAQMAAIFSVWNTSKQPGVLRYPHLDSGCLVLSLESWSPAKHNNPSSTKTGPDEPHNCMPLLKSKSHWVQWGLLLGKHACNFSLGPSESKGTWVHYKLVPQAQQSESVFCCTSWCPANSGNSLIQPAARVLPSQGTCTKTPLYVCIYKHVHLQVTYKMRAPWS